VEVLVVAFGYLLGTAPTAQLVARRTGHDPMREGSQNPGASNVYRTAGARAGALVFGGDALKGIVATAIGLLAGGRLLGLACGAAAVVGHVWPVTRRLRGGKGVATACGMLAVLFPVLAVAAAVVWGAIVKLTHTASVASLVVAVALPIGVVATGHPVGEVLGVVAVAALVVARHAGNIRRLARGDERTLQA